MHVRTPTQNSAYMEKAIQKATRLIELLTKENEDLKAELIKLQQQQKHSNIADEYKTIKKSLQSAKTSLREKDQEIQAITKRVCSLQNQVADKTSKNKQLHEKMAELTHKNNQNSRNLEKEKKKNLALQNENQYLLKNFTMYEAKENQFQNYCDFAEDQFKKELVLMDRTKTAFSRKCEQLKNENMELRKQIVSFRVICSELEKKNEEKRVEVTRQQELELEIKRTTDALSYIIQSTLKVKAENGLYLKVEQIKNYLTYRLQHIEKLIKPITDMLGDDSDLSKERMGRNLEDLATLATRLSTYLSDLIK